MKPYPSYKDSGVEWIEEIPSGWAVSKLKYFSSITLGKMLTPQDKGGFHLKPYLRNKNVQVNSVNIDDIKEMWFPDNELIKYRLNKFDLLVNEGGDVGRTCLWINELDECYIQNSVNKVEILNGNKKYYLYHFYLHHQTGYFDSIVNRVSIPHLTKEKLENVTFIQPRKSEQTQIVSFLDTKTQKIDTLIEKTEKKIELLKEKRTSLINHCVTKGLNPNVKMKDSGVEWIGDYPSGWGVKKLKYFSTLLTEKEDTSKDDIKISPENVESYTGVCFNLYSEYDGKGVPFNSGDILLNKLRLYLVKILLPDYDGFSMGEMIVIRVNENVSNRYYFYLLFNQGLIDLLDSQSTGIKVPRVSPEIIMGSYLPYPPKEEQTQIVEYLDEQTQKIDSTIEKETQRIELLKEYRQSLISEVVTGKVDVRDWKE